MTETKQSSTLLKGLRALDLTDEKGFMAGQILAYMGVDVIKIERPGGDPARRKGPFWHDVADGEKSLYWFSYNTNKRGITLDIETNDGKSIFKDMVKGADFVIESFDPGYLDKIGLGYEDLRAVNESVILTSITPFGQTGPYKDYKASDIVLTGMSGELFLTGDSDRPPVNISLPQACLHAGCDAAVGSMLAYHARKRTGEGQHVDVALQHSLAWFLATTIPYWEIDKVILGRVGTFRSGSSSGTVQRQVWPCKDGFIFFFMIGGQQGAKTCRALVKWMVDLGVRDEFLESYEWEKFDMASATQDLIDRISKPIYDFFTTRTKKEALDAAISRNISICPLFSMEDIVNDPNLAARGYWKYLEHPELKESIPYPKRFVRSSEVSTDAEFRAPLVGEHNGEVYGEMGFSPHAIVALKEAGII